MTILIMRTAINSLKLMTKKMPSYSHKLNVIVNLLKLHSPSTKEVKERRTYEKSDCLNFEFVRILRDNHDAMLQLSKTQERCFFRLFLKSFLLVK